jgi:hypothetical protein
MCLIILAREGIDVPNSHLTEGYKSNNDGCGIAWVEGETIQIFKTLKFEEFMEKYDEVSKVVKDSPLLIHFRKKSVGDINQDSCHPFKINDDMCFVHNGTMSTGSLFIEKGESDTMAFNNSILKMLPDLWWSNAAILDLIEYFVDPGRMVFLHKSGAIHIINEDDNCGHWDTKKEIWYSNYSYHTGISSLQKTKPTDYQLQQALQPSCHHVNSFGQRSWRGSYSGKEFNNSIQNGDWLNWPGPEDDWVCTICGEFNWANVDSCDCGCNKINGMICKYTKQTKKATVYVQCPHCKKYTNSAKEYCEECATVRKTGEPAKINQSEETKQLPLLEGIACSFCGREKEIVYKTKYIGTTISLCKKCEQVLLTEPEMYFPKHLLRDRQTNILNKCN